MNHEAREGLTPSPSRVLVVASDPAYRDAVDHAVTSAGHEAIHARDAASAIVVAEESMPDAVIICAADFAEELVETCARLRKATPLTCPVFMVLPPPVGPGVRKLVLRAGATHAVEAPMDAEEFGIRLSHWVAGAREVDRIRTTALVDAETGLYNAAGLARRVRELGAEAVRSHAALACIVVSAVIDGPAASDANASTAEALRATGRLSDVIGRIGHLEFIVVAPGTTNSGAQQLTRRLAGSVRNALARGLGPGQSCRVQAGYTAMDNLAYVPIDPGELLWRATSALRTGRQWTFEWLPPTDLERVASA